MNGNCHVIFEIVCTSLSYLFVTSFWYQFLHFRLTYSFTHHFFLFWFATLLICNFLSLPAQNLPVSQILPHSFTYSHVLCTKFSWPLHQLLSAHKYTVSYRIITNTVFRPVLCHCWIVTWRASKLWEICSHRSIFRDWFWRVCVKWAVLPSIGSLVVNEERMTSGHWSGFCCVQCFDSDGWITGRRTSGLYKPLSANPQRFSGTGGGGGPQGNWTDPGSPGKMAVKWKQ